MRRNWAMGGAGVWSAGLLVAAVTVPVYQSSYTTASTTTGGPPVTGVVVRSAARTLVQENGGKVVLVVAIPLILVVAVALLLPRHRPLAWVVTVLSILFCLLAILSIGIFVAPVALLLVIGCALDYAAPPVSAT